MKKDMANDGADTESGEQPGGHMASVPDTQTADEQKISADIHMYAAEEVLEVAAEMGVELLRCGADVHRVEDTITRICTAYGATRTDVFAIPSLINAEIVMPDGSSAARIRRIAITYNHLGRLERINNLSRSICSDPQPLESVKKSIEEIRRFRPMPEWLCYVGGTLATGGFTLFFGGTLLDGLAAALIGLLLTLFERHPKVAINAMARTSISSFVAGLLAQLCVAVGLGTHMDMIIIGTIMLEIPGLSLGNALRDMLCGDTISGSLRLIRAILQALMMALGYMAAMALCTYLWGGAAL